MSCFVFELIWAASGAYAMMHHTHSISPSGYLNVNETLKQCPTRLPRQKGA